MQAPITKSSKFKTPSGLTFSSNKQRTTVQSDPTDPYSLVTQVDTTTVNGRATSSTYEAATKQYTHSTPENRSTVTGVDSLGRLISSQAPDRAQVSYNYNALGQVATITEGSGGGARTTTFGYDVSGRLFSVIDPIMRSVTFIYDGANRVIQQVLPGTRTVQFGYDANGNMTSLTPPDKTAHTFTHTQMDLVATYTAPTVGTGSSQTSYSYNMDRQLTQVSRPDGKVLQIGYDSTGRLATLTLPRGTVTYSYNPTTGTVSSITSPDGIGLSLTHDSSLMTGQSWTGAVQGSVTSAYDSNLWVASRLVNGASAVSFTRDNDGLLTGSGALSISRDNTSGLITSTALGGVMTGRVHNAFGELSGTSATFGATALFSTAYTRDAMGRITQLTETVQGVTSNFVYEYDTAGRLWKVTLDGLLMAEHTYDQNGNRTSYEDGLGVTISGTYDAQDRLTAYGVTTYTYTAAGELATRTDASGTTTYTYDVLGNLISVALPGGTTVTYLIDGQNRRVGKKVNGTLVAGWLYKDGLNPVAELDGSNNVVSRFVYGTRANIPDYMIKGGRTYRIVSDHLGSARLVVDSATGIVAQRIDYDEWGQVIMDTSPGFQPFGFAGGIYGHQTRLVRFGARDYDAEVGRWTSKDPIGFAGGSNLYQYAMNSPIRMRDPSGRVIVFDSPEAAEELVGPLVDLMFSKKGLELLDDLMDSEKEYKLGLCPCKLTQSHPSRKKPSACINQSQDLRFRDPSGKEHKVSPQRKLAHELGHLQRPQDTENSIVDGVENPIMTELGEPFNSTGSIPVLSPDCPCK